MDSATEQLLIALGLLYYKQGKQQNCFEKQLNVNMKEL